MRHKIIIGAMMLLSGCSLTPLQKDFSCPYKAGEPCLSISQADQKSLDNTLGKPSKGGNAKGGKGEVTPIFYDYPTLPADSLAPTREPEVVQRIWLAPFEDLDHNWHAASYVYAIAENSKWNPQGVWVPEALSKPMEVDVPEK